MLHSGLDPFQSAHAAGAPWEGQNALDGALSWELVLDQLTDLLFDLAAFLAYSAISALRQQVSQTCTRPPSPTQLICCWLGTLWNADQAHSPSSRNH